MNLITIDFAGLLAAIGICAQIFFIDLLLSADNALVIALACRGLPEAEGRRTVILGTAGAIGLRLVMAAILLVFLQLTYIKLIAGITLLAIAIRLTTGQDAHDAAAGTIGSRSMLNAVIAIIAADAVMSLDNVVALAAVAQGSLLLLGFGLALSVPMLIQGSTMIRKLFDENFLLVLLSGMFLGWLAGQIGVSDPAVAPWIAANAPALNFAVPTACAVFVAWESWILISARARNGVLDVR